MAIVILNVTNCREYAELHVGHLRLHHDIQYTYNTTRQRNSHMVDK